MHDLLQDFIDATAKVNQTLVDLAEMGLEKQQLIIFNQVKELDSLIRREGILINNLTRLEAARYKAQASLASYFEIVAEDFTAAVLLDKVRKNKEYDEFYQGLEKELDQTTHLITRLRDINTHNNELIEQSLDHIDAMQALLSGDRAGTYSEQGEQMEEESRPRMGLLDRKV